MAKISLAGFKDPVRRPRYIIWTGVVVLLLAAFVIVALGVTSTYWFCANVCHKVQDDTIIAYNASSHNKISCMACHMPVNADPFTFLLHKATALGELYTTVTNKYEVPLNPESEVALTMKETQCTQCHSENRKISPSPGIIIDHKVHSENAVTCTLCHNRVAHPEDFDLTTKNPDGTPSHKHENYMTMTACFRCHGLQKDAKAPGACSKCHPKDFQLKPPSHLEKDFYPKKHAELAKEAAKAVEEAKAEAAAGKAGTSTEGSSEVASGTSSLAVSKAYASGGEVSKWAEELPKVAEVNYCSTCHLETFCTNCHGMEMPHSEEFKTKTHPELVKTKLDKCDMCHNIKKTNYLFCNNCHHGTKSNWTYDPKTPWQQQHAKAVVKNGIDACLAACHQKQFCYDCHTKLKPVPSSHKAATWLRKPKSELGDHASAFKSQPTSCEICHGPNEPNGSKFCKGCHVLDMPHPQEFKQFHSKTGKAEPKVCANCHTFKELCSDCHHEGAIDGKPWVTVHGGVVNKNGAANCFEKCHKQDFCVACHTARRVVPASHKAAGWTRRVNLDTAALHPAAYDKTPDNCTYCHGTGTPTENKFCMGCHKIAMPHPSGFGPGKDVKPTKDNGGAHADGFKKNTLNRNVCANCHTTASCNKCHHSYTGALPWVNYHPTVVKKSGAQPCFDCHAETFCSYCHVRQASKYIGQ